MSTHSTKFSGSKKKTTSESVGNKAQTQLGETPTTNISFRTWIMLAGVVLLLGTFLRVYDLNLVPLHHDEGVNGNFLVKLVRDGVYQYDPANYHGPTLYYFSAFVPWLLQILFGKAARETYGLTTVAIRLVPAVFGIATIWLVLLLRRYLGSVATLSAALLLALSPGAVYLSRYFIHETLFVFFTLGVVVSLLKCYNDRNPFYLLIGSGSTALLFATKETSIISAAVLLIALAMTLGYFRLFKPAFSSGKSKSKKHPDGFDTFVHELGGPINSVIWVLLALVVFAGLNIIFYSSFFTNYPKGVYDALRTFDFWTKTGKEAHVHPVTTYLQWLLNQEAPLLFLAALGAVMAVLARKRPVAVFCSLWAFGIIAAYSLVPYKTPWLALNFIVPLSIVAGCAIQSVYEQDRQQARLPAVILFIAASVSSYQTVDLNFVNYDNDKTYYVYVYAHTKRDTNALVAEVDKIALKRNQGSTGITIMSPDYWPLPWYLRNYSRVGYFGRLTQTTEPIVIASGTQRAEVEASLGPQYQLVRSSSSDGSFSLRPGVELLLYVRRGP